MHVADLIHWHTFCFPSAFTGNKSGFNIAEGKASFSRKVQSCFHTCIYLHCLQTKPDRETHHALTISKLHMPFLPRMYIVNLCTHSTIQTESSTSSDSPHNCPHTHSTRISFKRSIDKNQVIEFLPQKSRSTLTNAESFSFLLRKQQQHYHSSIIYNLHKRLAQNNPAGPGSLCPLFMLR